MAAQIRDKFCVLLVDDDPDTRAMYAIALSLSQFDVLESEDGVTALSTASEFLPDVIVTDLSGPNLDGFELLEWLQANPETARIRTIVLTGRSDETTADALRPYVLNSSSSRACRALSRSTCFVHWLMPRPESTALGIVLIALATCIRSAAPTIRPDAQQAVASSPTRAAPASYHRISDPADDGTV